jgi:hypothetical protein
LGNEEASKKNILKVDQVSIESTIQYLRLETNPTVAFVFSQMFAYPSFAYGMYVTAFNRTGVPEAPVYLYRCSVETKLNYLK